MVHMYKILGENRNEQGRQTSLTEPFNGTYFYSTSQMILTVITCTISYEVYQQDYKKQLYTSIYNLFTRLNKYFQQRQAQSEDNLPVTL